MARTNRPAPYRVRPRIRRAPCALRNSADAGRAKSRRPREDWAALPGAWGALRTAVAPAWQIFLANRATDSVFSVAEARHGRQEAASIHPRYTGHGLIGHRTPVRQRPRQRQYDQVRQPEYPITKEEPN